MARVKYLKSTLREVVFQLRFPKILKLMEEPPAAFQELLISAYPFYSVQKNETIFEVNGKQQQSSENNHSFIAKSGLTKINLTSYFIAVSTLEYDRWETFKLKIEDILEKFFSCYNIPGIQRIGLRYKNIIVRGKLGLRDCSWSELLDESVLGPLATCTDISRYKTEFEIKNTDKCFTTRHYELVRDFASSELAMLLDCDYYNVGFFKAEEVSGHSEKLHELSEKFIVDSHKDLLLKAMQPQELSK